MKNVFVKVVSDCICIVIFIVIWGRRVIIFYINVKLGDQISFLSIFRNLVGSVIILRLEDFDFVDKFVCYYVGFRIDKNNIKFVC